MNAFTTLRAAGVTTRAAAALTGIARTTMDRATRSSPVPLPTPLPLAPQTAPTQNAVPKNKLSNAEEQQVIAVLHSPEFIDQAPAEVYATLLERGEYLCSIATMYRILRRYKEVRDRRRHARHPSRARPELTATGPGQVYTWDITKLPGPRRGVWFDAYVMIDWGYLPRSGGRRRSRTCWRTSASIGRTRDHGCPTTTRSARPCSRR